MKTTATILVADDQSANRALLAGLLSTHGHHVVEASDRDTAMELCRVHRPDLLIADILLPPTDGPELARGLQSDPATAAVRVMFYGSSVVADEMRQLAGLCGATGVLVSPSSPEALRAAVKQALESPPPHPLAPPAPEKLVGDQLSALTVKLFRQTDESNLLNTQLAALIELGRRQFNGASAEPMLAAYCHEARRILGARYAALGLLDAATGALKSLHTSGWAEDSTPPAPEAARSELLDRILAAPSPVCCAAEPGAAPLTLWPGHPPVRALLGVRVAADPQAHGWLVVADKLRASAFTQQDERLAQMLAAQLAHAYDRDRLTEGLRQYAQKLENEIQARQRTEGTLAKLSRAVEQTASSVVITDREGIIEYVNPAFTNTSGYTAEEALGKTPRLLNSGIQSPIFFTRLWETILGGRTFEDVFINRKKTGELYHVKKTVSPIRDANSRITHFVATGVDVTEQVIAARHQSLQLALTRLLAEATTLTEAGPQLISFICKEAGWELGVFWLLDTTKRRLLCENIWHTPGLDAAQFEAASRVMKIAPGEDLPGRVWETGEPAWLADVASSPDFRRAAPAANADLHGAFAFPIRAGAGVIGVVEFFCHEVRKVDGGFLRMTADLGRQIGLFVQRRRAEEALHKNLNLLRAVVEGTSDAVFVKDLQGRYVMINTAAASLMGRPAGGIIGQSDSDLLPPGAAQASMEADRRLMLAGAAETFEETRTIGGQTRSYLTSRGPFRDSDGRVIGLICAARDITEVKRLDEKLRAAAKMEAIGQLAGGVAHDFNNLLTGILGCSDILLRRLPGDHPMREYAAEVKNAARRAASLTSQLLAFSRKQVIQPRVLDLNQVIADVNKMVERLIAENIELVVRLGENVGHIEADPGQIEQVLLNLCVNARDAMPQGGRLTIETASMRLDEDYARNHPGTDPGLYAVLSVADTGCGMDAETLSHIFEPFFTTKEVGKGTGLGLATVYGIAQQHHGHVTVESEVGKGSTFRVCLPCTPEAASEAGGEWLAHDELKGRETVLLVEDEQTLRRVLAEELEMLGYKVLLAQDGAEGLEIARRQEGPLDLIITDVVMPKMSGPDLVKQLRSTFPGLCVLYISGYTDDALDADKAAGPDTGFLRKPFYPEELARQARMLLDRRPGIGKT